MNDPIKNIRREVTLEERYTNVSEQLANMSERYDALSSALEKERLLRSEMVNEQAASELAALHKLHEEEVARIKAEARAEILRELSQREAEVEKRSASLDQREKELDVRLEKANDLLIPKTIDYARREFERAKTENVFLPNFGLASFQIIYGVEELIIELGLTGSDKIAYRKENAAIAWQSLLAWCVFTVNDVPQNSQMHKACNYVIRHYDELTAYMDYDMVPLDNNATESAIRALVMGKQNYLFCQNEESCHYAAVMYTFFAACKVLKINPEKWLSDVLDKISFTPKEKLSELLPQNWIKSNPQAIV